MRTQVAAAGARPVELVLSHQLDRAGLDAIVLERRGRADVQRRLRAGVLERATVDLLDRLGGADRLCRAGLVHPGPELRPPGGRNGVVRPMRRRVPVATLLGGSSRHCGLPGPCVPTNSLAERKVTTP